MLCPIDRARLILLRDATLASLPERLARVHGGRRLVEEADGGPQLTYRQAAEAVRAWSGAIAARANPGEVVVIATPNGYEQFLLCFAAARAGMIPAPVSDHMRPKEIDHIVADSAAALVIRSARDLEAPTPPPAPPPAPLPVPPPAAAVAGRDDVGAIFYTSGTTGAPKGVALTHRALLGQAELAAAYPRRLRRDEAVIALPVAHIMGFAVLAGLACAGIPTYLLPRFHPARVLDAIESRRATIFVGVPAMYRMLEEAGAAHRDLTSVRLWGAGADVMPAELAQRFKQRGAIARVPGLGAVGAAAFVEVYGMVEAGGGVLAKVSPPFLQAGRGPFGEALGVTLPGYDTRVVGPDGRELGAGEVGELQVRGPGVLREYWGDRAATAEVLTPDGWLRTGDLARKGPLGMLVFEGRAKHVIKRGGFSVYAKEVEQALERHPQVLAAAVVGLPDPTLGEVPAAAVRLRRGADLESLDLASWLAEQLASYKIPARFLAVDDLPRTGTQKVQKHALVELFADPDA